MMNSISPMLEKIKLPRMVNAYQVFQNGGKPADLRKELYEEMDISLVKQKIRPGMSVAITAGSRNISNMVAVLRWIGEYLKEHGAKPFVVPAMGSHGGATAEGQVALLNNYGINSDTISMDILSSMEVVEIGHYSNGKPVYVDSYAFKADGVIAMNRIKPHTGFRGAYESGIMKMLVVGLGKHKGAEIAHSGGMDRVPFYVEEGAKVFLKELNIIVGVGIIEDAYDRTAAIKVLKKEEILQIEPELLKLAKGLMASIMIDNIDVLIINEIGKNYSGSGMDPNITKRFTNKSLMQEELAKKIVVLDLSDESHGNAIGIGMANMVTEKLVYKMNRVATYINGITAGIDESSKIPMIFPNDKLAIQAALATAKVTEVSEMRIVRIKNTLDLQEIQISENLIDEAIQSDSIKIKGTPKPFQFNKEGNLEEF